MPYLLDGNNLIGLVRKTARPTEEDRNALIAELAGRLRTTRARAVLFFDGPGGGRGVSLGPLSIRASGGGSADAAILAAVESAAAAAECIVVTADRALARRVRDAGGKVCSPADFFARFGRPAEVEGGRRTEPVDVEDWLKWFEDEGNREGSKPGRPTAS
jgi:hypothetical protein